MQGRRHEYCVETLHRMWASGESYYAIAAALGCLVSFVHRLKMRHKLPNRQRTLREVYAGDPTPEQIAERAAEQRAKREMPEDRARHVGTHCYGWDGYSFVPRA